MAEQVQRQSPISDYMTTRDSAAYLRIAYGTLRDSRMTGVLLGKKAPPHKKMGPAQSSRIYYQPSDLDVFLDQFEWRETGSALK